MPLTFNPDDIEEKRPFEALPEGQYEFKVFSAIEKTSKNNNEMIELSLIINEKSSKRLIKDFLVSSEKAKYKIKKFCQSTNMMDSYSIGILNSEDCIDKEGSCILGIEITDSGYKRNFIKDYIIKKEESVINEEVKPEIILNDDIPF